MRKYSKWTILFNGLLKTINGVVKALFQSNSNNDFKRLKDFIAR